MRTKLILLTALFTLPSIASHGSDAQATDAKATDAKGTRSDSVDFNRDIRPILSDRCFACHGPDQAARKADLRLDVRKSAVEVAIEPGDAANSELIARISSTDPELRMPPPDSNKRPISSAELTAIQRWIDAGAQYHSHWSYRAAKRRSMPRESPSEWGGNEIDVFVLRRLRTAGLEPSVRADSHTLVRRLSFDLTGLPPAFDDSFLDQQRYERLVDRLLASPHYGERMATFWLDLVRYADTVGYHGDQVHNIAPYREYVINAFNDNLPFDQFTREQLAGDLLPRATDEQRIATGYNRLLQTSHEGGVQPKEYLAKYSADRVRNFSEVWLGGTMGCAECHDHKYDPYRQRDFYSLAAFFADIDEQQHFTKGTNSNPTARPPELDVLSRVDRRRVSNICRRRTEIAQLLAIDRCDSGSLQAELAALSDVEERMERTRTMITVSTSPRTIRVFPRGEWLDESGPEVQPAVPAFLPAMSAAEPTRLDLANWLFQPDHPLTARVIVNRLWAMFFGTGLSSVLDDLGSQGEPPSHPELLDWLAVEFRTSGWDVKHIVRLIVTSQAYQQSSLDRADLNDRDPANRLVARQSRYRLPAEMIRDNALVLSGLFVDRLGGAIAKPYQPPGYYANLNFPTREYEPSADLQQYRRGVYVHWQRQFLHPMLKAFDAPSREECTAQRVRSNTPSAALALLNDPSFVEASRAFAERIIREGGDQVDDRLAWAWRTTLTRNPEPTEREALRHLLDHHLDSFRRAPAQAEKLLGIGNYPPDGTLERTEVAAWTSVVRVLLNLNETITRN